MPVYEYSCTNGCENYDIWRPMDQRQSETDCPLCGGHGSRVFNPPMTFTGPLRLKREVSEPRLIRKEQPGSPSTGPRLRDGGSSRPWMLNRGC